jgi:hypothetical protein
VGWGTVARKCCLADPVSAAFLSAAGPRRRPAQVDQIYHLACPASPVHYKYNPVKTIKARAGRTRARAHTPSPQTRWTAACPRAAALRPCLADAPRRAGRFAPRRRT